MKYINSNSRTISDEKINFSLNVIKCAAIFAVICIHCSIYKLGNKGLIINALSRFAVPIFFLISGYFSYYKNNDNALEKYKKRIIRLIKLIILSNLIYLIFTSHSFDVFSLFTFERIFRYIIFNLSPTSEHLWFLQALIYCYILYYFIGKLNIDYKRLYKYAPILLLSALFLGEFSLYNHIKFPIIYYRNFLFLGLPFFTLGYLIHDRQEIVSEISNNSLIYMMVFGCFLTIIEVLTVGTVDLYIGTIFFSVSLFIWCVKNPNTLNFKITGLIGGKLYASMYILHVLVLKTVKKYIGTTYVSPIIVFIITLFISLIIYFMLKLARKKL